METKKLELTTGLIGVNGIFCSYWGYGQAETILNEDMIEYDFEENVTDIHPDYYYSNFNNARYMKALSERVHCFLDEQLTDIFKDVLGIDIDYQCEAYSSPREYNFTTDMHNFDISSKDFDKLIEYCLKNEEKFAKFLKDHYTSCDGFISFTANNIPDLMEDAESDDMTAWGAMVSYLVSNEIDEQSFIYEAIEAMGRDMYYSEFVDYSELDEWLDDLKNGRLLYGKLDEEWQKALFNRDIANTIVFESKVSEMYTTGMSHKEMAEKISKDMGLHDVAIDSILSGIKLYCDKVEEYNYKLDI
jgi:hypothetical protein